jgi:hypothetical protein
VGAAVGSTVRLCSIVSAFPFRVSLFGKRPGNTGNALMNEKNPMMAEV